MHNAWIPSKYVLDIIHLMSNTRTNDEWLYNLRASGASQDAAIADLRVLLLRAVLFFFNRNLDDFRSLARDEILQLAEDCAQEALRSEEHTSELQSRLHLVCR